VELPVGIVIYELDLPRFEQREPILRERFRHDGTVDGSLAYASVRHQNALGGLMLYEEYLSSALKMFKRDWNLANPL